MTRLLNAPDPFIPYREPPQPVATFEDWRAVFCAALSGYVSQGYRLDGLRQSEAAADAAMPIITEAKRRLAGGQ